MSADDTDTPQDVEYALARRPSGEMVVPEITDAMVQRAEGNIANVAKVRQLALRVTTPNDWCDQDGQPYLTESGVMKQAMLFGISFTDQRVEKEIDEIGGKAFIRFHAVVTAHWGGRSIEGDGSASSDKPFYSRRKGSDIPLSEIKLDNIRKHAVTNAQGRAVKKLLGLGGMTWDIVRGAGIQQSQTAKVDYAASRDKREAAPALKVRNLVADLSQGDADEGLRILRAYTTFADEKTKQERYCGGWDRLTDARALRILPKVTADWEKMMGREPGSEA